MKEPKSIAVIQKLEELGFNTLNQTLYKFGNALLLGSLVISLLFIGVIIFSYFLIPNSFYLMLACGASALFSFINFSIIFLATKSTTKRNDTIVIRKYTNGAGTISTTNLNNNSSILFDPKDPTSMVQISWAGAITDLVTKNKIIQISEGKRINDPLNMQVTEGEWDKDVAKLTKAKSVADLAEAELFNQGMFGLKWQDIVLVVIGLVALGTLGYLIVGTPGAVAKETIEGLLGGALQQAIAGVVVPTPLPTA